MAFSFDDFRQLCEQRRSVRYFDDTPLTTEEIRSLLALAINAPSVENTQPWRFHVILNKEMRAKLLEAVCYGDFLPGAGAFVVVTADRRSTPSTGEVLWNPQELEYSCATAMTYALLGAAARGMGGCWISLHHGPLHEILQLPKHEQIVGGMMLGHLRKGEEKASAPHERKALDAVTQWYE